MSNIYGNLDNVGESQIESLQKHQIHADVKISDITYTSGGNEETESLNVFFKKTVGKVDFMLTFKAFPLTRQSWHDDESFQKDIDAWNHRLQHIAEALDIELATFKAAVSASTSLQTYAEAFINLLTPKLDGRSFYLKVFSNTKGYSALPKYPRFLQKMSDGESTLAWSKWEKAEISKRDQEVPNTDEVMEIEEDEDLSLSED